MSTKTFTFSAVVDYEIDETIAATLLVMHGGGRAVEEWLSNHCPKMGESSYNANQLRESLGKYLAEKRVEECRQLTMSCHESVAVPAETTTNPES